MGKRIALVFGLALVPAIAFVFFWKQVLVMVVLLLFLASSPFALLLFPVFLIILFGIAITVSILFANYALQKKLIKEIEN